MKDNFSAQASLYQQFRPTYPEALYQYLLALVEGRDRAWDVGTGNGQVAVALASFFAQVTATDISRQQLDQAPNHPRVAYHLLPAEKTPFPDNSFDLITVGQAAHWFELEQFYHEVNRVGKHRGILALWGYGLLSIDLGLDPLLQHFYSEVVGPYWDPERMLVDQAYSTIPFPFQEEPAFTGFIEVEWRREDLEGYLNTWSSVQAYQKVHPQNPVTELMPRIKEVWPAEEKKMVRFPIFSRIGRIQK